eukprot:Gb_11238 [translate_table: standard]
MDTAINEDDDDTISMIKELLDTCIRLVVQDDGGDIEYHKFDPKTIIVKLKMQGACSGYPSSLTSKYGIENMLMHYLPRTNLAKVKRAPKFAVGKGGAVVGTPNVRVNGAFRWTLESPIVEKAPAPALAFMLVRESLVVGHKGRRRRNHAHVMTMTMEKK